MAVVPTYTLAGVELCAQPRQPAEAPLRVATRERLLQHARQPAETRLRAAPRERLLQHAPEHGISPGGQAMFSPWNSCARLGFGWLRMVVRNRILVDRDMPGALAILAAFVARMQLPAWSEPRCQGSCDQHQHATTASTRLPSDPVPPCPATVPAGIQSLTAASPPSTPTISTVPERQPLHGGH